MDESQGVIGNRKRIRNEVRVEALVIKEMDFNAVATSQKPRALYRRYYST